MENAGVSAFRRTLLRISKELTDSEVQQLKFLCKDHVALKQRENITDALGLFEILEQQGIISEADCTFLIGTMEDLQRSDLKKKLQQIGTESKADQSDSRHSRKQSQEPGISTSSASGSRPSGDRCPKTYELIRSPFTAGNSINSEYNYGACQPPDQSRPVGNPPLTFDSSIPQGPLMAPAKFHPPFPEDKSEGPKYKPLGSLSDRPSSVGRGDASRGVYGSPSAISRDAQRTYPKSLATSSSHQNDPTGQSSHEAAGLVLTDSSPGTSGSPASWLGSAKKEQSGNLAEGGKVEQMFEQLCLQTPGQSVKPSPGPDFSDNVDIETDSPMLFRPRGPPPQAVIGQLVTVETSSPTGSLSSQLDRQSASGPVAGVSADGITREISQERRPPEMSLEKQVGRMDQMFMQHEDREQTRAANRRRPNLRNYQKELAERPLQAFHNHIICAPTGSGKTLTAAYICYQYWSWFQTNVPHKHFKALFIVNMRHLTVQQRDAFRSYFPDKHDVQIMGEQSFEKALMLDDAKPAVLMLTAQILVNALNSTKHKLDIRDLDMLIFDECHHTDLKHPYNEIMKTYLKQKQRLPRPQQVGVSGPRLPFIIGLSASLGVGRGHALDHLLTLCGNMDSKGVVQVLRNLAELKKFVNSPEEDNIKLVSTRAPNDKKFAGLLEALMTKIEDQLPDIEANALPPRGCQPYEAEVKRRHIDAQKTGDRTAVIVYMYLYEYNRAMMIYDDLRVTDGLGHLERFRERRLVTARKMQVPVEEHCLQLFDTNHTELQRLGRAEDEHSNDKLAKLAILLHGIFTDKPNSKGIVLMRMKVATTAVADFIKKSTLLRALPCRVLPQRFVGQGDIEDGCMTEAQQKAVLESFKREDGCNVLVATDIAQEGLDMPACNFVIRYNFVSNEIGTVQSKGRARAEGSQCFLIVESGSMNEKREYENRNKVKQMKEAMENLDAMTEADRLYKIQERQTEILEMIRIAEEKEERHQAVTNLENITILCKECSALVCKASELRRKGDAGHVTCISAEFKRWVKHVKYRKPQRYRDTETVGLVKCGTQDCGNQLGTMQNFLECYPPEGYALKAQSFKIRYAQGGIKIPKIWKKAGFPILKGE